MVWPVSFGCPRPQPRRARAFRLDILSSIPTCAIWNAKNKWFVIINVFLTLYFLEMKKPVIGPTHTEPKKKLNVTWTMWVGPSILLKCLNTFKKSHFFSFTKFSTGKLTDGWKVKFSAGIFHRWTKKLKPLIWPIQPI